ncbi:MAG: MSMEG_0567/sll0787 family protein [Solirubrobacteraceae bacterium]
MATLDLIQRLGGPPPRADGPPAFLVVDAGGDRRPIDAYRELRRRAFVDEQRLFVGDDLDADDTGEHTRILVALAADGEVVGGVRLHPCTADPGLGWWRGGRLVAESCPGIPRGRIGAALVGAACATALELGALRFDAHVQPVQVRFFTRLGWTPIRPVEVAGAPHMLMRWPVDRIAALSMATKGPLGPLLLGLRPGGEGWLGDDGALVPRAGATGPQMVATTDAIVPAMVERDPEWAGWCGMLVAAHDLSAMGAAPSGVLDALGVPNAAAAARVIAGLRRGAEALRLPILGGHTQLGVPAALSVTGLGFAEHPVPAGGGRAGDELTLTADLHGDWRSGYRGRQWDSTSWRTAADLELMLSAVGRARPRAAKDVSMAGVVGTAGMLAEASGCAAELEVARIPRPPGVNAGDWLTCFPGFAMITADAPGAAPLPAGAAVGAVCGRLRPGRGVRLIWPDGDATVALEGAVTGLGPAGRSR